MTLLSTQTTISDGPEAATTAPLETRTPLQKGSLRDQVGEGVVVGGKEGSARMGFWPGGAMKLSSAAPALILAAVLTWLSGSGTRS